MNSEIHVRELKADNVSDWTAIDYTVHRAAPPVEVTSETIFRIREAIKAGEMKAWLFSNGTPIGVALTTIREDEILGRKEMIVYAAAGLRDISNDEWMGCYDKMRLHSKLHGCTHISFYTHVERLVKLAAAMGASETLRYVQIPMGG